MNKATKYVLLIIVGLSALGLIAYVIYISTFQIFDLPDKIILKEDCDNKSIRKATLYKMPGNAASNPSVHIEIGDCRESATPNKTTSIFTADKPNLNDNDVSIKWASFDSLIVDFDPDLRLFTNAREVIFPDSTSNVQIIYRARQ